MRAVLKTFLFVLLISCNNSSKESLNNFEISSIEAQADDVKLINQKKSFDINKNQNDKKPGVERKLIKNGNIAFETEDLAKTKTNILNIVKQYEGYISNENENTYGDRKTINLTLRIPSESFDSILEGISKNASKLDNKDIRITDVTEEFLDVEARLKNKKELEIKFLDILKKAKSVQEILNVERELNKLREEIESTEGRLKYLQNQVAFSTLRVSFYKTSYTNISFGSKILEGFKNGVENLKGFFIGIINVWPFIILFVLILIILRKRLKKK